MRTTVPAAFRLAFRGPEGFYTVHFLPTEEWTGVIVSVGDVTMRWQVVVADQEESGLFVLGGMTDGSDSLWDDPFWFELRFSGLQPVIGIGAIRLSGVKIAPPDFGRSAYRR